jgi:hypothetical protein
MRTFRVFLFGLPLCVGACGSERQDGQGGPGLPDADDGGVGEDDGGTGGDGDGNGTGDGTDPGDGDDGGDGDGSDGDDGGDDDPKFDVGEMPDAGTPDDGGGVPLWLLHIDSEQKLNHISIADAQVTELCQLIDLATGEPPDASFATLTFNREDRLFASSGYKLWEIMLPSCDVIEVGSFGGGYGGIFGIAPDEDGNGLLGISSDVDQLVHIDENTGLATSVGALGQDWFLHGATWVEEEELVYGIRGIDNGLYEISPDSGSASLSATLEVLFDNVGMEHHPHTGVIYACTNDGFLYEVVEDGTMVTVGTTGLTKCSNLGAPWGEPELPPAG